MRRLLLISLCLALLVGAAGAATVLRVGVDDLTDQATVVVRGTVLSVTVKWSDDRSTIHTQTVLSVTKVLKGKAGKEITVTCPGGKVGDEEVRTSGLPKFVKGEEVIVFLWRNARGEYIPNGYNQGRFRIRKDEKTGKEMAENSLDGLSFQAAPDGKGGRRKIKRTPDAFGAAELEKKVADRVEVLRRLADAQRRIAAAQKRIAEAERRIAEAEKKIGEAVNRPDEAGKRAAEALKRATEAEKKAEQAEKAATALERMAGESEKAGS